MANPLYDDQSEQGAIGCLMLDADACWPELDARGVTSEWFYDERNAQAFIIAQELRDKGVPVNLVTLTQRAKALGYGENLAYYTSLPDATPSAGMLPFFLDAIHPLCLRRSFVAAAEAVRRAAIDPGADIETVIASAEKLSAYMVRQSTESLPLIVDASSLVCAAPEKPAELVYGLLHKGSKLVLGGGSKSFKTWTLTDLAISVSHGEPYLGHKTAKGRVLYLNLELQDWSFAERIRAIAKAKNIKLQPGQLDVWNLRGKSASYDVLLPKIKARIRDQYSLVVLDPIYKILGDLEENSAGDIGKLLNAIESLSTDTGAAVAFGAHFSKGNQSAKEAIDRISGSGVFARDPDSIMVLTRHEQDGAFTVETILRNFKPLEPFVIRWDFPLFRRDDSLDPARLKQPKAGRPTVYTEATIIEHLGEQSLPPKEWFKVTSEETGIGRTKFYELVNELRQSKRIKKNTKGEWYQVQSVNSETN